MQQHSNGFAPEAFLEVGNTVTYVRNLPQELKPYLDHALSYPTDQAVPQGSSWAPPEASVSGGAHIWDGRVRFANFPREQPGVCSFPTGLLDHVTHVLDWARIPFRIRDSRVRPPEGVPDREAIPLRPYQRAAAEAAYKRGHGALEMPPRSGKTRTAAEVHRMVSLPTLWTAPTSNIVTQTVRSLTELFGKNYAVEVVGQKGLEKHMHAPVTVMTNATAASAPQEFLETRAMWIGDEAHHQAGASLRTLNSRTEHIFYRLFLSGTLFRSGNDDLAMWSVVGRPVFSVQPEQLIPEFLVPCHVVFLPLNCASIPKYAGQTFQSGAGQHGIFQHEYRNNLAAWAAATLWSRGKHTLGLVATKAQGVALQQATQQFLPGKRPGGWEAVEFVSTDRPTARCQQVIDAFAERHFPVLWGTSMVGEGTDLPTADALVYAPGGKAEVPHQQATYRVCTAVPGKKHGIVVDFADKHHPRLLEHSLQRLRTYCGERTFTATVLETPEQFLGWLDNLPS